MLFKMSKTPVLFIRSGQILTEFLQLKSKTEITFPFSFFYFLLANPTFQPPKPTEIAPLMDTFSSGNDIVT